MAMAGLPVTQCKLNAQGELLHFWSAKYNLFHQPSLDLVTLDVRDADFGQTVQNKVQDLRNHNGACHDEPGGEHNLRKFV